MSIFTDIEADGQKVGKFLQNLVTGAAALQREFGQLEPATLAAVSAVFYDVVKAEAAGTAAAGAAEAGNIPAAFTLSETTLALVRQVIADVKAGKSVFVSDFKALNIKL